MPDLTKCTNADCPLSWNCWRFNCPPDKIWQSYDTFTPDEEGNCDMYIDMDKTKKTKQKKVIND